MNIAPWLLFPLALAALGSIALNLVRYRTVLLGFTFFSFFHIASAGLSAFLFSSAFQLNQVWITSHHKGAFVATAIGLLGYSTGVWLAWRPLRATGPGEIWQLPQAGASPEGAGEAEQAGLPWLNQRFVYLCLGLSVAVYFLTPLAFAVPTLGTIWNTFYTLLPLGVLVAVIYSKIRRDNTPLLVAGLVFAPLVLFNAVYSGFIGAGGLFLMQLLLVICFSRGWSIRAGLVFLVGLLLLSSLLAGWLSSRAVIRGGSLEGLGAVDRMQTFVGEFQYTNPLDLTPMDMQLLIRDRVDMSDILAAQVAFQPGFEPYSYGGTVFPSLLGAIVPRVLWPEKPTVAGGSEFVSRYTGLYFDSKTSVGLPYQFELYANGGAPAVALGLFLIGWCTARLELWLIRGRHTLASFLALFFFTYSVALGAQTIIALLTTLIIGTIAFYCLGLLLERLTPSWQYWQDDQPGARLPASAPRPESVAHARPRNP